MMPVGWGIALLLAAAPVPDAPLEVGGRVFVRNVVELPRNGPFASDLSVASARLQVSYRRDEWLKLAVEMELAGKPELEDVYLRTRSGGWTAKAGHFKEPSSAIALESAWTLPLVRRGTVHQLLKDGLRIGGRRLGLQGEWDGEGALEPRIQVGLFRAAMWEPDGPGDLEGVGRVAVSSGPVEVGTFAALRVVELAPGLRPERFWTAGADVVSSTRAGPGTLRLWSDAVVGSSWFDDDPFDGAPTVFLAARAVGAYRFGGDDDGDAYVEPFALLGALDPSVRFRDDLVWEAAFGLNLGRWRRLRVGIALEARGASRNTPALLAAAAPELSSGRAVVAQLGGAF